MGEEDCEKKGDALASEFEEKLKKTQKKDVKLAVVASYYYLLAKNAVKLYAILERINDQKISAYATKVAEKIFPLLAKNPLLTKKAYAGAPDDVAVALALMKKGVLLTENLEYPVSVAIASKPLLSAFAKKQYEYGGSRTNHSQVMHNVFGGVFGFLNQVNEKSRDLYWHLILYSFLYPKELLEAIGLEEKKRSFSTS